MREGHFIGVGKQRLNLGRYANVVKAPQNSWTEADVTRRIWQKDGTVWVPDPGSPLEAFAERERRLIRLHIRGDVTDGLKHLRDSLLEKEG